MSDETEPKQIIFTTDAPPKITGDWTLFQLLAMGDAFQRMIQKILQDTKVTNGESVVPKSDL